MRTVTYLILISLISCKRNNEFIWANVKINTDLSSNEAYTELNKQKEFNSLQNHFDTSLKRSSGVTTIHIADKQNLINSFSYNVCQAKYINADKLSIDIGVNSGLGTDGFIINYENSKFYTEPYRTSDIDPENYYSKSSVKIIQQNLTLDKVKYNVGDSLYGVIFFHIHLDQEMEYFGTGYFRAKIFK